MGKDETPSLDNQAWLRDERFRAVIDALLAAGGEARAVGGCVRDGLMGEHVGDVDIATTLRPEKVIEAGKKAGLGVHPTGLDHGTVTLVAGSVDDRKAFEVTTLRVDAQSDGRHAKVIFTDDWKLDSLRRDFTMNALYCDINGALFDPVSGLEDIRARHVRFVGDASARIREDYLRILRFYRFYARFGKGAPDDAARQACRALKDGLDRLSRERVRQEFFKLLSASGAAQTVEKMVEDEILGHVVSADLESQNLSNLLNIMQKNELQQDPLLCVSALFPTFGAAEARRALVLTNEETKRMELIKIAPRISPLFRDEEIDRLLYWTGADTFYDVLVLNWAACGAAPDGGDWRHVLQRWRDWKRPLFPVSGADLKERGLEEGPDLGACLQNLEDWWVAGGFKEDKNSLLQRLNGTN